MNRQAERELKRHIDNVWPVIAKKTQSALKQSALVGCFFGLGFGQFSAKVFEPSWFAVAGFAVLAALAVLVLWPKIDTKPIDESQPDQQLKPERGAE